MFSPFLHWVDVRLAGSAWVLHHIFPSFGLNLHSAHAVQSQIEWTERKSCYFFEHCIIRSTAKCPSLCADLHSPPSCHKLVSVSRGDRCPELAEADTCSILERIKRQLQSLSHQLWHRQGDRLQSNPRYQELGRGNSQTFYLCVW